MSHAQSSSTPSTESGNWWALAVRGIAAVLFGLAALIWPGLTLAVLIVLFGAYVLVDGGFAIVAGFRSADGTRRALLLAEGILGILAGLIALLWPGVAAIFLLYVVAFWAILGGLLRIVSAVLLRKKIENEWTMAASGVLSIVLGVILAVFPGIGLLSYAWLIGVVSLAVGATLIALAFKVRSNRPNGSGRVA